MTLLVLEQAAALRQHLDMQRSAGKRVSVVPTMGALHRGHQALIAEATRHGEEVVVTIFVNPTQFGPGEDFERYPRTFEQDLLRAQEAGATCVFSPRAEEMYPPGEETRIVPGALAAPLCGASRPGHFSGVLTVVAKFMNLLSPASFVFGRKDFQQLRVIQRMVQDLLIPVTIVEHPIVREPDGLALSSRNVYLSPEQRASALSIPRALARAGRMFSAGERQPAQLLEPVVSSIQAAGLRIDYAELRDSTTLTPADRTCEAPLLAIAAFCGPTRLIDNLRLGVDPEPEVP